MKPIDLEDRLIDFAVRIVHVVEALPDTKVGNHIARQLVRSGTSPAPNYGEAHSAESRRDSVHRMFEGTPRQNSALPDFNNHQSSIDNR